MDSYISKTGVWGEGGRGWWGLVKRFLRIFLPLVVVTGAIAFMVHYIDLRKELSLTFTQEANSVDTRAKNLGEELGLFVTDLMYLANHKEFRDMPERPGKAWKRSLAGEFMRFAASRDFYDQIRLLDEDGNEVVRVNNIGGKAMVAPEGELQMKGGRYYFKEAMALGRDEIYISPFDLNVERGGVEVPIKPVVRLSTPVFDKRGSRRGVLVLNCLGARLIKSFEESAIGAPGDVMLLNADGYYLKGMKPEEEWGFMFPERKTDTFAGFYPDEWRMINGNEGGQFYNENGLFTFSTAYPLLEAYRAARRPRPEGVPGVKSYQWKIVSHIPYNALWESSSAYLHRILQLYVFLVILLALISGYIAFLGARKREAEEEARRKAALLEDSNRELKDLNEKLRWEVGVRKSAEESVMKMSRTIEERALELEAANRELEAFGYVASHDLQEPLRIIAGYVQLLEKRYRGRLDKDADEFIGYAVDGTKRMQRLITDLLNYSRVGPRAMELRPVETSDIFNQALSNLKASLDESGAVVEGGNLPCVTGDGRQLLQLFMNLVGNAVKYRGEEPPRIYVNAVERPEEWLFSVKDNGIGIDPRHRDRIFQLFQRLHPKDQHSGTGIGLSICKKVVENHGGRIWVESGPGAGSTFYFTIPKRSV